MVSYYLMFHVVRSFLVFSGLGLKSPALDFSFILPVVSRLLQLYSPDNKTSRLKVKKILHCEGHPERFTELHEEEERAEGDRDEQEEKKGDSRGETDLRSCLFPEWSP